MPEHPTEQQIVVEPREGDVFNFAYNQAEYERARGDLNWWFDGQLVWNGHKFYDTYWGLTRGAVDGRPLTLGEARTKGVLHFVCNLNDVEKIQDYEFPLYAEGDAFNLSHNHGSCRYYARRKGAPK